MYFGRNHIESGLTYSHEFATLLMYHIPVKQIFLTVNVTLGESDILCL